MAVPRRDLLKIGAVSAALPGATAAAGPGSAATQTAAAFQSAAAPWRPELFDAHQDRTVTLLADLIIPATDTPGARAALVNRHLDKLLNASATSARDEFLGGLGWLDGFALRRHEKPFADCTPPQQSEMLTVLSREGAEAELAPGRAFFRLMKSYTARLYYATETGFKELNKGGRVPSHYACTHPEHKA
jgi:hypothetical protein